MTVTWWYSVQTATINPEAQGVAFKDEIMGRLIRFVSAHGSHTLGLPQQVAVLPILSIHCVRPVYSKYGTALRLWTMHVSIMSLNRVTKE